MSLIGRVLDEIKGNNGVANLDELSQRLDIQPAALQGILNFCAQKGFLALDSSTSGENGCVSCDSSTGCPWAGQVVTCYRLKEH